MLLIIMYILCQIQVTEWKVELQFSWSLHKKKGDVLVQALGS